MGEHGPGVIWMTVIGYIHAHLNGSEGKCSIELLPQATLDLAETLNLDKLLMHDVAVRWYLLFVHEYWENRQS